MSEQVKSRHYDVAVVGGGAAGVNAAIAASENGARTVLIEGNPFVGGELLSGLPILGCCNSQGEWLAGGPAQQLLDACEALDGYVGKLLFDWRTSWGACVDPEIMKLAILDTLSKHDVSLLVSTSAQDVIVDDESVIRGIVVRNKSGRTLITADAFVDASGDGVVANGAGAELERGDSEGNFQPVSLTFRISNVNFSRFLEFVRDNPNEFMLSQNAIIKHSPEESAHEIYESGYPFVALTAEDPSTIMAKAIETGEMFPSTGIWIWPTSMPRKEVGFNTTRVANIDPTNEEVLGNIFATLSDQVQTAVKFARKYLPGYENSYLAGVAPRIGIRETYRIVGEAVLRNSDVLEGNKSDEVVAKGGHHVDLHGSGTYQKRIPVKDGKSYDVPYGALIPKHVKNLLVAGRLLSSEREANGSVRHMGSCMSTGQAAGTAAALCANGNLKDVRSLDTGQIRDAVKSHGGVIDGVA